MFKGSLRLLKSVVFKAPLFCIFRVTSSCNFACKMCSVWRHGDRKHELSLAEVEKLGKILKKLNISIITLGGGEPFMREDIVEIVKILNKNFTVRMQTNSVLATESKIKALAGAGLKGVTVSLDSLNPQKQDSICNSKGAWYKIIEMMTLFSQILPKRGRLMFSNAVVSKLNIHEVPRLAAFVNKIGYLAMFLPILLSTSEKHDDTFRDYAPDLAFSKEDYPLIDSIYGELTEMKRRGIGIANSFPFLKESASFLKRNFHWKCDAARLYFHIDSDGSFLPCTEIGKTSSFLQDGFIDKFHSGEFKKIVEEKIRNCPGCLQACQVETSKLMHDPSVFFEKFRTVIKLALQKRNCLDYQEAIKYADSST